MIVFGRSGNKYVFYVQSETINTDRITNAIIDIEVLNKKQGANGGAAYSSGGHLNSNGYAQDGTSADATFTRNLQKEDWIEKIPVDPTKFRFDIEVYVPNPDDIIIAPERVWRDNIFTYIDLGEKALTAVQRPIVTLIVERSETPVGFRAAGPNNRLIIVEGMGDMVLRSGKRIVCLKLRRADSDGLENTVYAKTNEWDLQSEYASKPVSKENETTGNKQTIEDVYGSEPSNSGYAPVNTPAEESSFFNSSNFINSQNKTGQNVNVSASLDSLPKAALVVGVRNQDNVAAEAATSNTNTGNKNVLTGQYDLDIGKSEIVVPDYNNQNLNVDVTYAQDAQKQNIPTQNTASQNVVSRNEIKNNANAGKGQSQNNSNPILIMPQTQQNPDNNQISAETEALLKEFRSGKVYEDANESNISIELGTDENVNNLEKLWNDISKRYAAAIGGYHPFYSVDTAADGQGKEVFHLRVGPVKSLDEGDNICNQLGRNGIFCSVVRIQ